MWEPPAYTPFSEILCTKSTPEFQGSIARSHKVQLQQREVQLQHREVQLQLSEVQLLLHIVGYVVTQ